MVILRSYSMVELQALTIPPVTFIVEQGLLPNGSNMILYGDQGSWKSWIAIDLAFAIARGGEWLNKYQCNKGVVLLLQTEVPFHIYADRLKSFMRRRFGSQPIPDTIRLCSDTTVRLDNAMNRDAFQHLLSDTKPDVVILDNVYSSTASAIKEEQSVKNYIDTVKSVQQMYPQLAWVHIHHTRKGEGDTTDEMYGSKVLAWWADTVIRTREVKRDHNPLLGLSFEKVRNSPTMVESTHIRVTREALDFHEDIWT